MKRFMPLVLVSFLSGGSLALWAQDTNISGLYNTGQGQGANGETALHYTLFSSPGDNYPVVYVPSSIPTAWDMNSFANSLWISPVADANNNVSAGNYDYRLTFNLENSSSQTLNPLTAEITGIWAVDNYGVLELNGTPVATNGTLDPNDPSGFSSPTAFDITSGFQSGLNTLDFIVDNLGSDPTPSGLIVQFSSGTAEIEPAPEPGIFALSVAGFTLLMFQRGKKFRS